MKSYYCKYFFFTINNKNYFRITLRSILTCTMSTFLSISVGDESTLIQYVSDNEVLLTNTHSIGLKHVDALGLNKEAASSILDGIHFTLDHISLYDRIPTEFRLISPRYITWLKTVIEEESYAQFYTAGVPVRVTLERIQGLENNPSLQHAGHTKTIFTFKV